jgi:hypothetical protein
VPGLLVFPISVAVAVLRYRLMDAEAIINRPIAYGLLFLEPRESREPYSREEFEALQEVAAEVARAVRLAKRKG